MNDKIKNSCPNCCQLYSFKTLASEPKSNIPLFIKCGHSMCENCVLNIVKFGEPIECKICLRTMEIKTTDVAMLLQNKIQLYKLFPVNVTILGELALELIAEKPEKEDNKSEDYFIDLQTILDSTGQTQGQCLECHGETRKMCQQCATVICDDCFNKSHKNFVVFKNHVLRNIDHQRTPNNCKIHSQKSLEYYCKDCAKSICMDCLMMGSEKSCKNHDVVSTLEINEIFLSELREIFPQVDTVFRRLTKTAVDIGHLLHNMENDSGSSELRQVTASIEQHFSKLYATVQAHKEEVMNNVARLRRIEHDSLLRTGDDVANAIKESKQVMTALKSALDCEKNQSINLSALLEEAKNILKKPWCLTKDECNKDTLKVCVTEELCPLVSDYVQLVGNAQARYGLRATHELSSVPPPPLAPVYPPKLPKDVRFNKSMADKPRHIPSPSPLVPKGNSRRSTPEMKKAAIQAVMPFAEKKPVIELKAGVKEQAVVTHVENPHDFYVRRSQDESLLCELEQQLKGGEIPLNVTVGKMYAVKYEHSWKRGLVDGVDKGQELAYHVALVDYGFTVTVADKRLLEIPAALELGEGTRYPPLALRCRLANCEPSAGKWRADDTELMRRIVAGRPVLLHVRRAGAPSECDVTARDGVSVAHALCFHGRGVLTNPHLPYPEVAGATRPRLPAGDNKLRGGGEVLLVHVVSPSKFYVRESYLQADYFKLCEALNNAYDERDDNGCIYLPVVGMVCVVLVDETDDCGYAGWARALVTSCAAGSADVFLVDCGRQLTMSWQRLRVIENRFTALRALATECHLAGVWPRAHGRWGAPARARLAARAGRRLRLAAPRARPAPARSLGAALLDARARPPRCLNQELVDEGLADADGTVDFRLLFAEYYSPEEETEPRPPTPVKIENDAVTTDATIETAMTGHNREEFPADRMGSIRLEAKILLYESPSRLYISLLYQQKTFNELFEDIQKFYVKRKTPRRENWKANDRCCAFCLRSETWRRATILKTEKDKVTVFFTDFAQTETVPISNLKKLHSDFEVIGDAAMKCHLAGVMPASGEWPSLSKEFLKDRLDAYKRVFVTKVGQFVDTSMPVELWVYHTEQGSALEPDASEWRCLNAELVRRGLAVPDDTTQLETGSGDAADDELRFLNVRGSVQAWLLPPDCGSGSSEPGYNWLPPEPLRTTEFTAVPTNIDNDGVIYLHDVSQQDDLDFIRDTLQMAFKEPDPKAAYCTWRVGEPCVARYYLDNQFYRGMVLEVNADQATCLVQYIDYGNSELCAFVDLRKRVALHQIPIQAHKCSLSRIKPVGGQWDLTILDYVHKAIVEKKCFVKVVAPATEGITPIDLKYDKLWINDHLVEFGLAAYTDGSKPLEPKYKSKKKNNATSTPTKNERTEEVVESNVIELNSSSEPDYIVEEFTDSSQASGSPDSFKMSTLLDRDEGASETDVLSPAELVSYPQHEEREFECNIPVINDTDSLELSIIRDAKMNSMYEKLYETVKEEGNNMPPLHSTFEYKPCIALFEGNWYRASILKYSKAKNLIKVRYVDYGNIGIITLSDAREITKDCCRLSPACITARLHKVRVNPNLHPDEVTKAYVETFLDKGPFYANIIDYDNSVPLVELRNIQGELVYDKLIEDNIFLHDTCDNSTSN